MPKEITTVVSKLTQIKVSPVVQWVNREIALSKGDGPAALWDKNTEKTTLPASPKSQEKKNRAGVQEEICMAPSPRTNRGPGLQTSLVEDLCFLSTSRWRNTSSSSSQGRDGLLCRSSPPSIGLHWAYFSCMVDILLNTSFLDDMGDHSKSKLVLFLLLCCHSVALLWVLNFIFKS